MRETTPTTRLIASPKVHWDAVADYLDGIGGTVWFDRVSTLRAEHANDTIHGPSGTYTGDGSTASDAELLVEYAGRRCYRSWAPGLNANVTKVREDSGEYLENILRSKHGAVLEHAQFTFDFDQVSRVFTHELVRHRAGVAISQESMRYVRLTDLGFRIPDILTSKDDEADPAALNMRQEVISIVERLEEFQRSAAEHFGLDDDGVPFHYKKEVTSALRRLAPIGVSTGMVWSANLRTLRHVIPTRTAPGAEEEIRIVFDQVARTMKTECPLLFVDLEPVEVEDSDVPHWVPAYEKV